MKRKISELKPNTGQIEGLPKNPRKWSKKALEKIKKSLESCPELTPARPLLVYKNIVIGGNLRYEGMKALGYEEVDAFEFDDDTPIEKIKEIAIRDNVEIGDWDVSELTKEWDSVKLKEWGVDMILDSNVEEKEEVEVPFSPRIQITFDSEKEQEKLYEELTGRGFLCELLFL